MTGLEKWKIRCLLAALSTTPLSDGGQRRSQREADTATAKRRSG